MSASMGAYMASKKAEGMLAPLLEEDEASSDSDDSSMDSDASSKVETVKKGPMEKLKSAAVYVGLGLGLVAAAGAMVISPGIPIFVMGGLTIANIPYTAVKERKMGNLPALRSMNNKLREDANNLEEQVDTLSNEIDALEPEAERAAAVEEELRDIAERQEVNVNKLVELVKENAVILQKMRENLRKRVVQDIIGIVVKSDKDNDQSIDSKEAKMIALKIRLHLQEYGVVFDSDKFVRAIGDDATVPGVIAMIQRIMPASKEAMAAKGEESDSDSEGSDSDSDDDSVFDMFHLEGAGDSTSSAGSLGSPGVPQGEKRVSLRKCDKKRSSTSSSGRRASTRGASEEEEDSRW